MFRIERIKISGFKAAKKNISVMFSPSNVSIIFGQNGCGKTSFLKILHAIFSRDESVLIQNEVNKIEIFYLRENKAYSTVIKKRSDPSVKNDSKSDYDWSNFLNSDLSEASSLSLGVDRGMINQPLKIDSRMIYDFFRGPSGKRLPKDINLISLSEDLSDHIRLYQIRYRNRNNNNSLEFEKKNLYLQSIKMDNIEELLIERYRIARMTATKRIQSALFDTLSVAISLDGNVGPNMESNIPNNFNELILLNSDRIIEALDDGSENNFKNTVIQILNDPNLESELERLKKHPILSQLFLNMINELKLEKQMLSSINLLVDTFNKFLINNKELVVSSDKVYIKADDQIHSINELSSGERHILTFISLVLFEGSRRDLLIIDEPEISLNLIWQRQLMALFSELIPETQIIVASHSPSLANNNPQFLCELEAE
ncbi:TPA: AAA family ATPase [Yersinia enterocolitica]|nr:AAA family ATPase [Yersinia enterocolitica]EKN4809001.1 AAA family ATPase [Yersinia enterocolitica]HDL7328382.1 AAA family ATPase [Yersinia enterocolitica]HDL7354609.1 AAA family ATPase [Yersinia enterocolitica]HDL7958344.1 AAA family ATPase [Yersinia enterocolitica]